MRNVTEDRKLFSEDFLIFLNNRNRAAGRLRQDIKDKKILKGSVLKGLTHEVLTKQNRRVDPLFPAQ